MLGEQTFLGKATGIALTCLTLQWAVGTTEPFNLMEFNVMCHLYRLATNPQQAPDLKAAEVETIFTTLKHLANATSDEEQDFRNSKNEMNGENYAWKSSFRRPIAGEERKIAHQRIKKLLLQADHLYNDFIESKKKVDEKTKAAKKNLEKAVYGDCKQETKDEGGCKDTMFSTSGASVRGTTGCGQDSNPGDAGKSIPHDITCICGVPNSGSSNNKPCGTAAGVTDTEWGNANGPKDQLDAWNKIKQLCRESTTQKASTQNIRHALGAFERVVGANVLTLQHTTGQHWILGAAQASATSGCAGTGTKGSSALFCVNYKALVGDKVQAGKGYDQIPWYAAMLAAAGELDEADQAAKTASNDELRLLQLNETAWDAYWQSLLASNDSKSSSEELSRTLAPDKEGQKQVGPTKSNPPGQEQNSSRSPDRTTLLPRLSLFVISFL